MVAVLSLVSARQPILVLLAHPTHPYPSLSHPFHFTLSLSVATKKERPKKLIACDQIRAPILIIGIQVIFHDKLSYQNKCLQELWNCNIAVAV